MIRAAGLALGSVWFLWVLLVFDCVAAAAYRFAPKPVEIAGRIFSGAFHVPAGFFHALVGISAADPLNLTGIVTAGDRIRTAGRNRIVYRDGVPLAVREGEFVRELTPLDPALAAEVSRALTARRTPAFAVH